MFSSHSIPKKCLKPVARFAMMSFQFLHGYLSKKTLLEHTFLLIHKPWCLLEEFLILVLKSKDPVIVGQVIQQLMLFFCWTFLSINYKKKYYL